MTELEQYLQEKLEQTKKSCEAWLKQQKQGLQEELNKFMLEKIAEAEHEIEVGQERYISKFKAEMADINNRRVSNTDDFMEGIYRSMEDSAKHSFELGLSTTEKIWRRFIEDCREQIK